jgi:hypothetical protein
LTTADVFEPLNFARGPAAEYLASEGLGRRFLKYMAT